MPERTLPDSMNGRNYVDTSPLSNTQEKALERALLKGRRKEGARELLNSMLFSIGCVIFVHLPGVWHTVYALIDAIFGQFIAMGDIEPIVRIFMPPILMITLLLTWNFTYKRINLFKRMYPHELVVKAAEESPEPDHTVNYFYEQVIDNHQKTRLIFSSHKPLVFLSAWKTAKILREKMLEEDEVISPLLIEQFHSYRSAKSSVWFKATSLLAEHYSVSEIIELFEFFETVPIWSERDKLFLKFALAVKTFDDTERKLPLEWQLELAFSQNNELLDEMGGSLNPVVLRKINKQL